MLEDFLVRSLIAGLLLSVVAGPVGSLIMWQRKAYFGDSLAHASILGVALSLFLDVNMSIGIVIILLAFATILTALERLNNIPSDTILGIMAHSSLALGLVLISMRQNLYFDLESFLFGNILSVTKQDIGLMALTSISISVLLKIFWSRLILISLNQNLAQAELGNKMHYIKTGFTLILALFIALNIKIVGILLINALLLTSAAIARQFAKSTLQMAIIGSVAACISIAAGMFMSYQIDLPTGAAIVVSLAGIFLVSLLFRFKV